MVVYKENLPVSSDGLVILSLILMVYSTACAIPDLY